VLEREVRLERGGSARVDDPAETRYVQDISWGISTPVGNGW
jgi:hypothetical protein